MTNMLQVVNNNTLTMSSREIAELTGKSLSHVHRDIGAMMVALVDDPDLDHVREDLDSRGYVVAFHLPKGLTMTLVAGYNVLLRKAIIDRWQELEEQAIKPVLPATYKEALIALVAEVEAREVAEQQLALAAPKVAFVDQYVERKSSQTATQVGQTMGISARKLNVCLDELGGVYSKKKGRGRVFLQEFVDKGYGVMKQTDTGHAQALFTPLGIEHVTAKLVGEGCI